MINYTGFHSTKDIEKAKAEIKKQRANMTGFIIAAMSKEQLENIGRKPIFPNWLTLQESNKGKTQDVLLRESGGKVCEIL